MFYLKVSSMQESQTSHAILEIVAEEDRKIYRRDCEVAPKDGCEENGGGGGVQNITHISPLMLCFCKGIEKMLLFH